MGPKFTFLTRSQVILVLLLQGPHFGNHWFRKNPEHVHIVLLCSSHEDLIHDSVVNLSFSVLTLGSNVKTVIQEKDTQLFFFLILLTGKG